MARLPARLADSCQRGPGSARQADRQSAEEAQEPEWPNESYREASQVLGIRASLLRRAAEAAHQAAWDRLGRGAKNFKGEQSLIVEDIAFRASKELARGSTSDELFPEERQALKLHGVVPRRHSTWTMHAGDCDGEGDGGGCMARSVELESQREEANRQRRMERAVESRRAAESISSGEIPLGSHVSLWRGHRTGLVVKLNRTTVKVRHIGPKQDANYAIIEANYPPEELSLIAVTEVNSGISIRCKPYGDQNLRQAKVVETDGPLALVEYVIGSGEERQKWIDTTKIKD